MAPDSMDYSEEDDGDEDDEYLDESDLGDWRSFRSALLDSDLTSDSSGEGYMGEETKDVTAAEPTMDANQPSTDSSEKRPKSVSKANEELLKKQSKSLAKEYTDGIWAHPLSAAEVGGLAVRLPLEVEIYRTREKTTIGNDLMELIDNDTGSDSSASLLSSDELERGSPNLSFSLVAAQTLLWYKKTQTFIEEQMVMIASQANERGEIDPQMLKPKVESFLNLYLDNQQTWQEVCLVAAKDETLGTAKTYALNRPMAFSLTDSLARLVFFGAFLMDERGVPVSRTNELAKFVRAFEKSCAVYVGGPDKQEQPAVMIHGISGLEGATELAPGTGIYEGGLNSAVQGILDGKYKPLDFRFFVGCHEYKNGDLDVAIVAEKYQPIACARPLALKQCIQLPKPLWHEVLELCGSELREVSRLELMKRNDIKGDE